ncbi:MAG: DinB family protein [Candidatus Kapaibacterium sp.]
MAGLTFIGKNYAFTHRITKSTLEGVSQEESLRAPEGGGNCINWILGHMLLTRDSMLESMGKARLWTDAEARKIYERGSAPLTESGNATDIATLLDIFDQTQAFLMEGIAYLEQHPTEDGKLEGTIGFLNFHESYHCGQLAILRRMLGKESIIK